MKPFILSQTVAPANVGQTRQPTGASTLGISGGYSSAVQGFLGTILGLELGRQMAKESNNSFIIPSHQTVELAPVGQGGESRWRLAKR